MPPEYQLQGIERPKKLLKCTSCGKEIWKKYETKKMFCDGCKRLKDNEKANVFRASGKSPNSNKRYLTQKTD